MIQKGDILKIKGMSEPCIQYRIINDQPQLMFSKVLNKLCPHIQIEAIGWTPVEALEKVIGSPDNTWAMDVWMKKNNISN